MKDLTVLLASLDRTARNVICPLFLMEDKTTGEAFLTAQRTKDARRAYCRVIAEIEHRYYVREPYVRIMPCDERNA